MKIEGTLTGFVIHRRPYRETSVIADFFTRSHGRVSAVVKGVRNAKSERKSLLQGFQPLNLQFAGRNDLKTLIQIEPVTNSVNLTGDDLYCGLYMNEVLVRAIPPGLEVEPLYLAYEQCVHALLDEPHLDVVLRHFEFTLLEELGVLPDLSVDAHTDMPICADKQYLFHTDVGFVELAYDPAGQAQSYAGETILAMLDRQWHADSRKLAKQLCRQLLQPLLGDKPLHSRDLFKR